MKERKLLKVLLCMMVAFAMAFTPFAGSYAGSATSYGTENEEVSGQSSGESSGEVSEETSVGASEEATEESPEETPEDSSSEQDMQGESVEAEEPPVGTEEDAIEATQDNRSEKAIRTVNEYSGARLGATRAASTSNNLNDFVTDATIDATKENGKYVVKPGSKYNISLTFTETMDLQFPDEEDAVMTYTLPEGLLAADGDEGEFTVRVNDGGSSYTIKGNTFKVVGNTIEVRFNTSDSNFSRLAAAANLTFNIAFEGEFDGENEEVMFNDQVDVDLEIDESHHVSAQKSGKVDTTGDKIDYTIVLTSDGKNTNIEVTDSLIFSERDLLTLDIYSINVESNKAESVDCSWGATQSSFVLQIPAMVDGERITITYSVKIDPTKIGKGTDGKVITTGRNDLTVSSEDDPATETKTIDSTINYTPGINKTGRTIGSNHDTLEWTVTANPAAKVSIAGYNIKDTIASASRQYVKYAGEGISVKVQDADNNTVREENIPWGQLPAANDYTWTYTVPDSDTIPYKYVITYITKADNSDLHKDVTVNNTATIDGGGSKSGSGKIGPLSNDDYLRLTKTATDVDLEKGTITWHVIMEVPKDGLDKAEVVDTYPNTTIGGQAVYEPVSEDSIRVSDMQDGESYKVNINEKSAVITFYKDPESSEPGLQKSTSGKKRYIYIDFDTQIKTEWLEASGLSLSEATHSNSISIDGGTGGKGSVIVQEPAIDKKTEPAGTRTEGGTEFPVYKYEVYLTHIEGDGNVSVLDRYDKSLLEPYTPDGSEDAWYVFGEGLDDKGNDKIVKGGQFNHEETADGMQFTIDKADLPKDNTTYNNYFPRYRLVYYLTVKDEAAFEKIIEGAIRDKEGKYKLTNTAEWDGKVDGGDIEYGYPGISKELLTTDKELTKTDEDVWADFRITANPSAQTVNGGKTIKMTDEAENLDIDITSIRINGEDEWPGVSYEMNGNTMTYWIPDATKIVITYRARVNFPADGKLQFSNVVKMLKYDDEIKKTAERNKSGGGVASVPAINLLKHEAGDISSKLAGAEFALLDENKDPIIDKSGKAVVYVTPENGMIHVRGDMAQLGWALQEEKTYYLRETKAPENCILPATEFRFRISKDGHTDHTQYIYHSGDTLSAGNFELTRLDVEKVWSDGNSNHDADEVTVRLQQRIGGEDGEWSNTIRVLNEDLEWTDNTDGITAVLTKSNDWKYRFDDLPQAVPEGEDFSGVNTKAEYRIVETAVNGKEHELVINGARYKDTTYDVEEDGTDSKVTVTNNYVPDIEISFEANKVFEHGKLDEDAMFTFNAFGVSDDGKLTLVAAGSTSATGDENSSVTFTPIRYTLDDLKKDDGTFATSKTFKYVVRETLPAAADENGFDSTSSIQYDTAVKNVTVTLSLEGNKLNADINYGDEGGMEFTNTLKPPTPPTTPPPTPPTSGTGDPMSAIIYLALMLAAALGITAAAGLRRRAARR